MAIAKSSVSPPSHGSGSVCLDILEKEKDHPALHGWPFLDYGCT